MFNFRNSYFCLIKQKKKQDKNICINILKIPAQLETTSTTAGGIYKKMTGKVLVLISDHFDTLLCESVAYCWL